MLTIESCVSLCFFIDNNLNKCTRKIEPSQKQGNTIEQNFLQEFYSQILSGRTKTTKTHACMTKDQNCPSGGRPKTGTRYDCKSDFLS